MRIAVVDLGTNTCNLLIAETVDRDYRILHQSKQLVKLGDDKIRDNEISPAAVQRSLQSFQSHQKVIREFNVDRIKVLATSAVRSAANKVPYLEQLGDKSGWLIKVISGEKEAELIFKGVMLAFKKIDEPALILDIGGGSNELILARHFEMIWKESRPTGMARVINNFLLSNPVNADQIRSLQDYFAAQHAAAIINGRKEKVKMLIGCSGAFDTIADIIDGVDPGTKQRKTQEISMVEFYEVYEKLLKSTREERILMKGMDHVRVDLIVPAIILIEKLIVEIGIEKIVQTDFALREGVLYELMENKKSL